MGEQIGIKIVGLFLIAMSAFGLNNINTWLHTGSPVEISCEDYLKSRPAGNWLKLSDCIVDFSQVVRVTQGKIEVTEGYYAPVLASIESQGPAILVLKLAGQDLGGIKSLFSDGEIEPELVERFAPRDLEMLIRSGLDDDGDVAAAIQRSGIALEENWKIVDEGGPQPIWVGILLIAPAVIFGGMIVAGYAGERRERMDLKTQVLTHAKTAAPSGTSILDISIIGSQLRRIGKVGAVLTGMVVGPALLFFGFDLILGDLSWPAKLALVFAAIALTIAVVSRLPYRRMGLWLPVVYAVGMTYVVVESVRETGFDRDGSIFDLCLPFGLLVLAFLVWRWARVKLPQLGLPTINIARRPRVRRPWAFASGRYGGTLLNAFLSNFYSLIGLTVAFLLWGIGELIGRIIPIYPNMLRIFGPAVVRPLVYQGSRAARLQRRYSSPDARSVLRSDKRAPILLLRSFGDDEIAVSEQSFFDHLYEDDQTFEEIVTDNLWSYGPVVAIGRPGEDLPLSGAVREYVDHDTWQDRVKELVDKAAAILLIMGPTQGFGWELESIARLGALGKAVLIIPPLPYMEVQRRWAVLVDELGVADRAADFAQCSNVIGALCVLEVDGGLITIRSDERSMIDYEVALDIAVRSVLARNSAGESSRRSELTSPPPTA